MWPLRRKKRHLRYKSISDWIAGENVPDGFLTHPDPVERDKYITQFGELRQHLFDQHIRTLPTPEKDQLARGRHPSQSHKFSADAKPYADKLRSHLRQLGCEALAVSVGLYHGDRIVLSVKLADFEADKLDSLPWLFSGFEIKYEVDTRIPT